MKNANTIKSNRWKAAGASLTSLLLTVGAAHAQNNPTFQYGKAEEPAANAPAVPPVEWKAQVKGGAVLTTGSSQTRSATFAASASRKEGNNKLALDGGLAYGHSNIIVATLGNPADPTEITALGRQDVTTTNNWNAKGRYDRFFTLNNSGYASAQAGADKIAGKTFIGGGQIGYSRQLLKNDMHLLVAEIGYDFSYESYVQQPMKTLDPVSINSARVFAGEQLKLSPATGITGSVEAFFNLNKEGKAISVDTKMAGVDAFKDTRVIGKLGLTTTLVKALSIGFGFTLKYDQNPAVLPVPGTAPSGAFFGTMVGTPFANKVDTLSEVTLIYTFL